VYNRRGIIERGRERRAERVGDGERGEGRSSQ